MEGWRSWGGASVLASCKLCLIGFINGYPGIMRPLLAGIFLKAVPRRGTPKKGHLLLVYRCYFYYVFVCYILCARGCHVILRHNRTGLLFCVSHTHNFQ